MMDVGSMLTIASAVGTGVGGFVGGRMSGRTSASQIATDTVEMLQAQIELLKQDKQHSELEILDLLSRVAVLEGLVTQRAQVDELSAKTMLVKDVVDRIADRVGA
jgi:hypothetical protein